MAKKDKTPPGINQEAQEELLQEVASPAPLSSRNEGWHPCTEAFTVREDHARFTYRGKSYDMRTINEEALAKLADDENLNGIIDRR